jgi:hypothetical protein
LESVNARNVRWDIGNSENLRTAPYITVLPLVLAAAARAAAFAALLEFLSPDVAGDGPPDEAASTGVEVAAAVALEASALLLVVPGVNESDGLE